MVMQIKRTSTPDNQPHGLLPGQLAVEMASNPPKLWVGVPTDIDPAQQLLLSEAGGGGSPFRTGDVKVTLRSSAEAGWVLMNDGTIGNAESGATTRAHPDCQALFELLWDIGDTWAPIFSNTGAPAVRANFGDVVSGWANNARMSLTRVLGRALAIGGQGAGLTHQTVGGFAGAEAVGLSEAQMPSHWHGPLAGNFVSYNDAGNPIVYLMSTPSSIWSYWHNVEPAGGNWAHSNMQPTTFLNVLMCL